MSIWLRIGGYPATEIAAHTPPTWETWADGGTGSISWAFALTARSQHQALRTRVLVEVMCGPLPLARGVMTDPDRSTGEFVAYGLASDGKNFPALDAGGSTTRDVGVAINTARDMGWMVTNPVPVTGTAAGEAVGNPVSVAQLLDDYATQTGQRWGVDHFGRVFMRPEPTTPSWLAAPDAAAFGTTSEGRATRLLGRYLDSGTSGYLTASAGSGAPVEVVDLTDRGAMTNVAATAVLQGALNRDNSQTAWTNGVTLTPDQLQTVGGTPAFLPSVRAGQLMRSFGLSYGSQSLALDTVIGKTKYTAGDQSIYVEPVNTAARSFTDVLAAKEANR